MGTAFTTIVFLIAATASTTGALNRTASKSNSNRDLLLVVNKGDQTLSIVDPESGRQLAAVSVGGATRHEVAASPDGRTAWVPIYGNSGVGSPGTDGKMVSVIDLKSHTKISSGKVEKLIDVGTGADRLAWAAAGAQ